MQRALRHPQTYAGVASLSGAFWPGMDEGVALRDQIPQMGKQPLAIYLDSGGNVAENTDGAADTVEVRDLLVNLGWQRADPTRRPERGLLLHPARRDPRRARLEIARLAVPRVPVSR